MKTTIEKMDALRAEIKQKEQSIANEEFFAIIKLESIPEPLLIVYENDKGKKITELSAIDDNEKPITSCKFKGRSKIGECKDWIVDLKKFLSQLTLKDLINNNLVLDMYKRYR